MSFTQSHIICWVTRCPALCGTVTHFHYFSHVPQIETLSRIVIDSQTPVLKCVFYHLAFIKWLCGESSEAVIRGRGALFDHVNQTGAQTQVKGAPSNKKQCKSGQNGTGMQHKTWGVFQKAGYVKTRSKLTLSKGKL